MKPETSSPQLAPEQLPVQQLPSVERKISPHTQELGIDTGVERREQAADATAIISDIGLITSQPTTVAAISNVVDDTTLDDNPLTANDEDLIEKEWVDRAKRIVASTQNDPHRRESEVSKLQVDYIKKRFGRELGAAE